MPDDKISELPLVPSGTPSKATDEAVVNFLNPDGSFTTMRDTFAKMKAFFSGDKENTGVAQTLLDTHVAQSDPHPQYLTSSDLDDQEKKHYYAFLNLATATIGSSFETDTKYTNVLIQDCLYTAEGRKLNGVLNGTFSAKAGQFVTIAIDNGDITNTFIWAVDKLPSTGGGGGIPEPTTDGNNVRTKSGSTLSWSQTELVSSTEKNTWNGKQSSLGFTPANKAGDTFAGNISASNLSGTNTGDETNTTIKSKLGTDLTNKADKPIDESIPTTGTITLDFNTETFDNITQTGSITFAGTNTTGSKKIVKTLVIQGSGNSAHTFTFPIGWINLSGVLPDFSKQNYIEITYLDGAVFFCVNKYSAVSTTTPTLVTATILQDSLSTIELKYDRLLDASNTPSNSWFTIVGKALSSVSIVNNTIRINVSVAFATTDTAILSFTNTSGTLDGLQDAIGNKCPDFINLNVVLVRYGYDDFNRTDSTTSVGTASDGTSWTVQSGTWGINDNKMYAVSAVGSGASTVPIILKNAEVDCSVKYTQTWPTGTNIATSLSCLLRWQDSNNYLLCQFGRNGNTKQVTAVVVKVLAGVVTTIGASTNVSIQNDGTSHSFICRVRGNQITMIYNGVIYQSVVDVNLPQGNKIGFRIFDGTGSAGNADRIDDVTIGL